jgi:hypothetical protein
VKSAPTWNPIALPLASLLETPLIVMAILGSQAVEGLLVLDLPHHVALQREERRPAHHAEFHAAGSDGHDRKRNVDGRFRA